MTHSIPCNMLVVHFTSPVAGTGSAVRELAATRWNREAQGCAIEGRLTHLRNSFSHFVC